MHLAIICLFTGCTIFAQNIDVQPIPQQVSKQGGQINLPETYQLLGETEANPYAVQELKDLLGGKHPANTGLRIYIGEKGDKSIRKFTRQIPNQKEGYYLSINNKEIILAGNDERGTYYALQTLKQLLKDNQLPIIEIQDYPAICYRGVVEGFYGTPWSHNARLRQLQFYGENKMNTYIYGPKDDPYHSSPNWRLPYPEKEAKQLQELVKVAQENEIDFVWAIHPGQDIKWNKEDRELLLAKFEKMYHLGVRSFAVFFDDISGEGTNPVKQAELLNYIDEHFVKVKPDVTPLIMCPTEYNKSWSDPAKGYLTTLGDKLNPSIQIMWTGDRVISDITQDGIQWINERIKRPAYIWWNFPVSDYVRDHLLMGPVYGNDTQIAHQMSGFVTNPMEHAEASKIAIYSVASYAWNPQKYNSEKTWKDAIMNNSTTSQAYNLNVTGGGRVAQYFVSLGYYSENGLFKTSDANSYNTNFKYNRYLITSKVNINVTDEFKVSMSLMGRIEEGNQPGGISGTGYSDLLSNVWQTPNNAYPVLNPNGTYGGNASYTQNLYAQTTGSGYISSNTRDVVGTINLKYDFDKLVRGLSVGATGNISSQVRNAIVRTKQAQVFQYSITQQGNEAYDKYGDVSSQTNSYRSVSTYQYMYGKMYVDWERQFGMHGVKASLWGDTRTILNNYDLPMIPSNIGQKVEYNYDNKYFAQAAVTESYYNRYDNGRRWGTFWAVGLGWDISKEKFMEASKIDQLKLRATYGHTGNGIDNAGYFSYLKRYNEDGGFWYSNGTSMSNGGSVSEISPLANTLLTWEKGRKVNVGLDLTLLKNRLTLSADYYNDYYYDILQSRGKSIELLGIAYPAENIGKTRYYGLETQLSWQDHIGKVNYYVSANWSMEQNKRLFMDEQYVPYDYLKMTGQPTGTIYGLVATGFLTAKDIADGYPVMNGFNNIQAGDVKYKDMNGDGEINEFDRTVIGGDKPTCYFGIDLGFEWKGLEVTALIQGAYNRDLYNSDRTLLEGFQVIGQSYGQAYTNLLNRWTPETAETATYPRLTAGGNMYNYGNNWNSSLFVQNGNYIRLKNATVSYKLPENFCRNYLGGLRVKIFVQGQNLLTWSRTRLQDPEVTFTSYPLQRTITTGINLNF